jgi:hypothetical protein
MTTSVAKSAKLWTLRRILALVACTPWAYFLWSGYDLCYGPSVRVNPNEGQVHLYVLTPLLGFLISIVLFIIANKLPTWAAAVALSVETLALLPLVGMWGGGI